MRISDWSSDVCSSDLVAHHLAVWLDTEARFERQLGDAGDWRGIRWQRAREQGFDLVEPAFGACDVGCIVNRRMRDDRQRRAQVVEHDEFFGAHQQDVGHAERIVLHRLRSEEHTSELQSLMRISYAVFCLKKNNTISTTN